MTAPVGAQNTCPICMDSDSNEPELTTRCNHVFHKVCLEQWLEEKDVCPICRAHSPWSNPNNPTIAAVFSANVEAGPSSTSQLQRGDGFRGEYIEDKVQLCQNLQRMIGLNFHDFEKACAEMRDLNIQGYFPITADYSKTRDLANNIYFHLYQIHITESPGKFNSDPDYGRKAFFNLDGCFSDPYERMRSIQRVIIDSVLPALRHCFECHHYQEACHFLDILETCSHEVINPAHFLYGEFYQMSQFNRPLYLPSVTDLVYKGDFGRVALRNEIGRDGAFFHIRAEAISKLQSVLEATWFNASNATAVPSNQIDQIRALNNSYTDAAKREAYQNLDPGMKDAIKAAIWELNNQSDLFFDINHASFYHPTEGYGLGAYIVVHELNSYLFEHAVKKVFDKYRA